MEHYDYKQVIIFINNSQKNGLVDFLDSIKYYGYAIVKNIESSWEKGKLHRDNHAWPGSDCMFYLTVKANEVDNLILGLKRYRMKQPENIVFGVGVLPVEKLIFNMYTHEISSEIIK